jgi:hypothetical protein
MLLLLGDTENDLLFEPRQGGSDGTKTVLSPDTSEQSREKHSL